MFELILGLSLIGVVLVFAEIYLPGMIAGVLGGAALLAAIGLTYAEYGVDNGNRMLVGSILFLGALLAWWMHSFSESRLGRLWTLQSAVPSAPLPAFPLENRIGKALTSLRPAGTALIEGRRVDVVAEGAMIDMGSPICVIRVEGRRVVVRMIEYRASDAMGKERPADI